MYVCISIYLSIYTRIYWQGIFASYIVAAALSAPAASALFT